MADIKDMSKDTNPETSVENLGFKFDSKAAAKIGKKRATINKEDASVVKGSSKKVKYGSFDTKTAATEKFINPRYEKIKGQVNAFGDLKDLERIAYQGQSGRDLAKNTAIGFTLNAVSGILDSFGANDPVAMANMLAENGAYQYENRFQRWAKSIKGATQDKFAIYKDGDNMWNAAYWADQLSNAGYSAGMMIETIGEQWLLAATTGGLGNVMSLTAKGAKATQAVTKVGKAAKTMDRVKDFVNSGRTFGAYQGIKNSYMNALGAGEATYNHYKELGHTEEVAKQKAAEASALNFKLQAIPLMVLNGFQYQAVMGKYNPFSGGKQKANTGLGSVVETFAERVLPKISNKIGKKATDYGVQMVSEAFEEGLETAMSSYAEWKILEKDGLTKNSFGDKLFSGTELRDSMIGGAIGGAMFKGMYSLVNKGYAKYKGDKQQQDYSEFLSKVSERATKDLKTLAKFDTSTEKGKADAEKHRKGMMRESAFEALQYDFLNQSEEGFESHIQTLENIKEVIESKDIEKIKGLGIENESEAKFLIDNIDNLINDANTTKSDFIENMEKFDGDALASFKASGYQSSLRDVAEARSKNEAAIEEFRNNDSGYKALSKKGQEYYDLYAENLLNEGIRLSGTSRVEDVELENQLQKEAQIKLKLSELSKSDEWENKSEDLKNMGLINAEKYGKLMMNRKGLDYSEKINKEELLKWNKHEFREEKKVKAAKKAVEAALSKESVEEAAKDTPTTETSKVNKEEALEKVKAKEIRAAEEKRVKIEEEKKAKEEANRVPSDNSQMSTEFDDPSMFEGEGQDLMSLFGDTNINEAASKMAEAFDSIEEQHENKNTGKKAWGEKEVEAILNNNNKSVTTTPVVPSVTKDVEPDDDFLPMGVKDFNAAQQERIKDLVGNYYEAIKRTYGKPDFHTFLKSISQQQGLEFTDKYFNVLVEGWKLNGYADSDFHAAYNDIFSVKAVGTQLVEGLTAMEGLFTDETSHITANERKITREVESNKEQKSVDGVIKPVVIDADAKELTFGAMYLSTPKEIREVDGKKVLVDSSDELNGEDDIKHHELLLDNKNSVKEGDELTIGVPDNFMSILITKYNEKGEPVGSETFGEYVTRLNLNENSPQYKARVPIVATNPKTGNPVFFVRDTNWYNEFNIKEVKGVSTEQQIAVGKENIGRLRDYVDSNGTVNITITHKGIGSVRQSVKPVDLGSKQGIKVGFINSSLNLFFHEGTPIPLEKIKGKPASGAIVELIEIPNAKEGEPQYQYYYLDDSKATLGNHKELKDMLGIILSNHMEWDNDLSPAENTAHNLSEIQRLSGSDQSTENIIKSFLNLGKESLGIDRKSYKTDEAWTSAIIDKSQSMYKSVFKDNVKGKTINSKLGDSMIFFDNFKPFIVTVSHISPEGKVTLSTKRIVKGNTNNPNRIGLGKAALGDKYNKPLFNSLKFSPSENFLQNSNRNIPYIGEDGGYNLSGVTNREVLHSLWKSNTNQYNVDGQIVNRVQRRIDFKISDNQNNLPIKQAKKIVEKNIETEISNKVNEESKPIIPISEENEEKVVKAAVKGVLEGGTNAADITIVQNSDIAKEIEEEVIKESTPEKLHVIVDNLFKSIVSSIPQEGGISKLDIKQESDLTDYIFNEYVATMALGGMTEKDLGIVTLEEMNDFVDSEMSKVDMLIEVVNLKSEDNKEELLEKLNDVKTTLELVKSKETQKLLLDKAKTKVEKYMSTVNIKDELSEAEEQGSEVNYSKGSVELDPKSQSSAKLKRFMVRTENRDSKGNLRRGFLGVPLFTSFDTVYNQVISALNNPSGLPSNIDTLLARLEEAAVGNQNIAQVLKNLETSNDEIKNMFGYEMTKHTLAMKFMAYKADGKGGFSQQVFDTNANDITKVIRSHFHTNFKNSKLVTTINGKASLDRKEIVRLLAVYKELNEGLRKKPGLNNTQKVNLLTEFMNGFGLIISPQTIVDLIEKKTKFSGSKGDVYHGFEGMVQNRQMLIGKLGSFLNSRLLDKDSDYPLENEVNNPFSDMAGLMNGLIYAEKKNATYPSPNAFRDGGKSVYGYTETKNATDTADLLKMATSPFRTAMLEKAYNQHSYMLKMLGGESSALRDKMEVNHLGITALKQLNADLFGDADVTNLSKADHDYAKLGLFADTKQGEIDSPYAIPMRMASMFFPNMSDKSQMLLLKTAVFNIKASNLESVYTNPISGELDITVKKEMIDILFDNMVLPELSRIFHFYQNQQGKSDIKGYEKAAGLFLNIPRLNGLKFKDVNGEETYFIDAIKATVGQGWDLDRFNKEFGGQVEGILRSLLNQEYQKTFNSFIENGVIYDKSGKNPDNPTNTKLDKTYLDSKGHPDFMNNHRIAAMDFAFNSLLTNSNIFMMFSGDPALYAKGSEVRKIDHKKGNYDSVIKSITDANMDKRLALLVAPGKKIANSVDEKYTQIMLKDYVAITANPLFIIEGNYGPEELERAKKLVASYHNDEEGALKELKRVYPEIEPYFDIEGADAQEYTTAEEHLNILFRQGRMKQSLYDKAIKKIRNQVASEAKGEPIREEDLLSHSLMKIMFQPIKPVYTGMIDDKVNGVMRTMYVKSSSFPLIPQMTAGKELDKVRRMMEKIAYTQNKDGSVTYKGVRASYQSANKVGATTNAINVFDSKGNFIKNEDSQILAASVELDRNNFRIQQDVPMKSLKNNDDKVSQGTQTLKLLFGDGLHKLKTEFFDGPALKARFDKTYSNLIDLIISDLYDEMGLSPDGEVENWDTVTTALQEMLINEAKDRGYSQNSIDGLELRKIYNDKGEQVGVDFTVPIWMSPDSNKFESLMNAIVNNRVNKIKLPGASYVAASEAGFKSTTLEESGVPLDKVIYTSSWEGELKAAEFYRDENDEIIGLKKAQVMVGPKFRDNDGKLIELIDKDGKPNPKYVEIKNGKMMVKNTISKDLLQMMSFRIPTSSHQSMSQLEIVGILPFESGDMMVVPRNLTTQKGLDFDVDKETTYQLRHSVDSEGKLIPFDEMYNLDEVNIQISESKDKKEIKKLKKIKKKILENQLVRLHYDVIGTTEPLVQKKISKVLSMDVANSQAAMITTVRDSQKKEEIFTMASPSHNRGKMEAGSSGKLGIGVYSNMVTFHSMVQQVNGLTIMEAKTAIIDGVEKSIGPKIDKVTFGNITSDGKIGVSDTLATKDKLPDKVRDKIKRSVTDVLAERQNIATDNVKEQVMGRVNINSVTINVDAALVAMGFDLDAWSITEAQYEDNKDGVIKLDDGKDKDGEPKYKYYRQGNIPFLFLSQPIMIDYVEGIKALSAQTKEFKANAKEEFIISLLKKYGYTGRDIQGDLSAKNLFSNLSETDNKTQIAVFDMFQTLDLKADTLRTIQSQLNSNKGLGKSRVEASDKFDGLGKIRGRYNPKKGTYLAGYEKLFGDVATKKDITSQHRRFGNLGIIPNNPMSKMVVESAYLAQKLWSPYFVYDTPLVKGYFDYILSVSKTNPESEYAVAEFKVKLLKEIKKYFNSLPENGIVSEDTRTQRRELFFDYKGNTSLSTWLAKNINDVDALKQNKLLARFTFETKENGPSLIKFNNTVGEAYDEDYLYAAIPTLLSQAGAIALPDKDGKPYTVDMLVNDLLSYTLLEGGVQEAVQFMKYIPISLLKERGYSDMFGNMTSKDFFDNISKGFEEQFFQNNPNLLPKVQANNIKKGKDGNFNITNPDGTEVLSPMVAVYNKNIKAPKKKFDIYWNNGVSFEKITTLGTFGMSEYNKSELDKIETSLLDEKFEKVKVVSKTKTTKLTQSIQDKDKEAVTERNRLEGIVEAIAKKKGGVNPYRFQIGLFKNFEKFNPGKGLEMYLRALKSDSIDEVQKGYIDAILPLIKGYTVKFEDRSGGVYQTNVGGRSRGTVILPNKPHNLTKKQFVRYLLHELAHANSSDYLNKYLESDGRTAKPNAPEDVKLMVKLYNEAINNKGEKFREDLEKSNKKRDRIRNEGSKEKISVSEINKYYHFYNVKEFVAEMFAKPDFYKEMSDTPSSLGGSIAKEFLKLIKNILNRLNPSGGFTEKSIAYNTAIAAGSIFNNNAKQLGIEVKEDNPFVDNTSNSDIKELLGQVPDFGESKSKTLFDGLPEGFNYGEEEYSSMPKDIIFNEEVSGPTNFDEGKSKTLFDGLPEGFDFQVVSNEGKGKIPFTTETIDRIVGGRQSISVRKRKFRVLNQNGIYIVKHKGKNRAFKVTNLDSKGWKFTLDSYLERYGITKESLFKETGIESIEDIREDSVKKFFNGEGTKNILHIEDITDRLKEFKEVQDTSMFNCA